jgi:hypothetical protein
MMIKKRKPQEEESFHESKRLKGEETEEVVEESGIIVDRKQ